MNFGSHIILFNFLSLTEMLTLIAIVVGPLLAIIVSKKNQIDEEIRERKLYIFRTLMTSRADRLALLHVQALNLIDIEFYGIKDVTSSWKLYIDHLSDAVAIQTSVEIWSLKQEELFLNLLFNMAKHLNYNFDKITLKRSSYFPQLQGKLEQETDILRSKLVELLNGKSPLNIKLAEQSLVVKE